MCRVFSSQEAALDGRLPWVAAVPQRTSPLSFFRRHVFVLLWAALLASSVPTRDSPPFSASANPTGCVDGFDPRAHVDYFVDKATVNVSSNIVIAYHEYYKLVTNRFAGETFVLYQCGTQVPPEYPDLPAFAVPVSSVGLSASTQATFLELLGRRTSIQYASNSGGELVYTSPCIQLLIEEGDIVPFSTIPMEKAAQVATLDLLLDDYNSSNAAPSSEYLETGTLQRSEWIKFFAVFFNQEARATSYFDGVVSRYDCHKEYTSTLSSKPNVAFVSYCAPAPWNGNVDGWFISNSAYKLEFVRDAAGTPLDPDITYYTDVDDVLDQLKDMDIVVDETFLDDTFDLFLKNFHLTPDSDYKFVQNRQVWREDKLQNADNAYDWFESALPQADVVLEDFISMIHPEVHEKNPHETVWLRNIGAGEGDVVVTSADCEDPDAILDPQIDDCDWGGAAAGVVFSRILLGSTVLAAVFLVEFF